jgi:transposase InsO family protein
MEKEEIIRIVVRSPEGITRSLMRLGIHKRTFYNWYHAYSESGIDGLYPRKRSSRRWNKIPQEQKELVVGLAKAHTDLSCRELSTKMTDEQKIFISESSVYRILKAEGLIWPAEHYFMQAADEFYRKTSFVHQMWQTDFTYLNIKGWGWYYLSTVLDDFSRYVIYWELCRTMTKEDVQRSIENAIKIAQINPNNPPQLLSDNGPCYIAKDLKDYLLSAFGVEQIHGKPLHPQTQGKIERYHKSMKNVVKLHHYYCPSELEDAIGKYVDYYNNKRYHESLKNLTPADVYWGRGEKILKKRQLIKEKTLKNRKKSYQQQQVLTEKTLNLHQ